MDLNEMHSMTDEDFLKAQAPVGESAPQPTEEELAAQAAAAQTESTQEQSGEQQEVAEGQGTQEQNQEVQPTEEELAAQAAAQAEAAAGKTPEQLEAERVAAVEAEADKEPDYKALYEGLIKPLKANGKEIQLQSHEELIQLAQQGANYTRKMQQLAPHRKTLMMLENNDLLDPDRLGYLIDLQRKDPAAIQKFLKESGVNPLDIDVEAEPTYTGGNHQVTDTQVAFRTAIDDARSSEVGMAVLQSIDSTWDQASKELLFKNPDVLNTMVVQHEAGFYGRITAEMERQRMLGTLPAGQSWLESYKDIGERLGKAGQFNDLVAQDQQQRQNQPPAQAAPVATRVVAPKPQVAAAAAKAAAAAPSRAAAAPAQTLKNPLEMDDQEFMKQFANRL